MVTWIEHVARWRDCVRCPLGHQRSNIVLARAGVAGGDAKGGSLPCDVLFCGEAPGASEDASGLPFWGPAGDLLQQIIDRALPTGTTYALTNLVACFPREAKVHGDNDPEHSEIVACRPRLLEFFQIVQPKLIVTVGSLATGYVDHQTTPMLSVEHPAYILRMPQVQKGYAANHCVVAIRCAWADAVESQGRITNRETKHAEQPKTSGHQPVDTGLYTDNIPF